MADSDVASIFDFLDAQEENDAEYQDENAPPKPQERASTDACDPTGDTHRRSGSDLSGFTSLSTSTPSVPPPRSPSPTPERPREARRGPAGPWLKQELPSQPLVAGRLALPIVLLDPGMQMYFFRMQWLARGTCDPDAISCEARGISSLFADEDKENLDVSVWAQRLFFAGVTSLEYTRSIAILVAELIEDLSWTSAQVAGDLSSALLGILRTAFFYSWYQTDLAYLDGYMGYDPVHPVLEPTRAQLLNIAAFAGDLFAVGVVPDAAMCEMAALLVYDLRSLTHCRALHLLLLRATMCAGTRLSPSVLLLWRERLVWVARGWDMFFVSDVARRWIIEICNVLDWMGCDERRAGGINESHRRDFSLCFDVMVEILQYAPCRPPQPVAEQGPPASHVGKPAKRVALQELHITPLSDVGGDGGSPQ